MRRRILAFLLTIALVFSYSSICLSCNESQTNTYVTQILFGENATGKEYDAEVKLLLNALYLCSEQSDSFGQNKLEYLKDKKVKNTPSLSSINISSGALLECAHHSWSYEYTAGVKAQSKRKQLLQNAVSRFFGVSSLKQWFKRDTQKYESFAALLYYSHILCDYIDDDPSETQVLVNGQNIPSFAGETTAVLNGNQPNFTDAQKKSRWGYLQFSPLDELGRCGVAFANISPELIESVPERDKNAMAQATPSGWTQEGYQEVGLQHLYDRSHLIAHSLAGEDTENNLITGTVYLNQKGMKPIEDKIARYIKDTKNHVLYRVTPIFKGENLIASGVQIEAYSVEDNGAGICLNQYCYNVQAGVSINYRTGENALCDSVKNADQMIPFVIGNPSADNPDLIYELTRNIIVLFENTEQTTNYTELVQGLTALADQARKHQNSKEYASLKADQYECLKLLTKYVPILLREDATFKAKF